MTLERTLQEVESAVEASKEDHETSDAPLSD